MRVAGVPLRIATSSMEELRQADIGVRLGPEHAGERLATLEEFIEAAGDRIGLAIELKYYGWDERLAGRVIEVVRRSGIEKTCEILSLEAKAISQVRRLAPEIRLGYLSSVAVGDLSRLDVDYLALADRVATSRLIGAAHDRGLDIYVWTLNSSDGVSDAIDRGADGIITDAPSLVGEVLEERSALSPTERLLLRFGALHRR
jgi:glycerophosphoryl diester phosphodiesterase